jgi:Cu/Ag efflux pump CusA
MQKLADICIRRPVFAAMIVLSLVVAGATSYFRLGVDRYPSVDLPTLTIRTTLPGASPEEIEASVSQRIEEAVNTVAGIEELRSISGTGASIIIVTFGLERDIDVAAQDVRDRVATVLRDLPVGTEAPIIRKIDNDSSPVMTVALSGDRPARELTELADKIVKVRLERSSGVGEVTIVGGLKRATTSGSTPTDWAPTGSRYRRAGRHRQSERQCAWWQRYPGPGGADATHDRPSGGSQGVRRPGACPNQRHARPVSATSAGQRTVPRNSVP